MIALDYALYHVLHMGAGDGPGTERLADFFQVQAGPLGYRHALGQRRSLHGADQVDQHLVGGPRADLAEVDITLGVGRQHRPCFFQGILVGADQQGESSCASAVGAAGDRAIDEPQPLFTQGAVQFHDPFPGQGRAFNGDGARLEDAGRNPVRPQPDGARGVIVADDGNDEIGAGGGFGRRRRRRGAGVDEGLGFSGGAVIDADPMTGLEQVKSHLPTHGADAEKGNFGHG